MDQLGGRDTLPSLPGARAIFGTQAYGGIVLRKWMGGWWFGGMMVVRGLERAAKVGHFWRRSSPMR